MSDHDVAQVPKRRTEEDVRLAVIRAADNHIRLFEAVSVLIDVNCDVAAGHLPTKSHRLQGMIGNVEKAAIILESVAKECRAAEAALRKWSGEEDGIFNKENGG